jgi:cell division GTPase FtsZ
MYDVSMRGARGLLISITGGRDLTLFEVDQAASRIREEVDPDANIIVGATFDESLEGVVRVAMVTAWPARLHFGSLARLRPGAVRALVPECRPHGRSRWSATTMATG